MVKKKMVKKKMVKKYVKKHNLVKTALTRRRSLDSSQIPCFHSRTVVLVEDGDGLLDVVDAHAEASLPTDRRRIEPRRIAEGGEHTETAVQITPLPHQTCLAVAQGSVAGRGHPR